MFLILGCVPGTSLSLDRTSYILKLSCVCVPIPQVEQGGRARGKGRDDDSGTQIWLSMILKRLGARNQGIGISWSHRRHSFKPSIVEEHEVIG